LYYIVIKTFATGILDWTLDSLWGDMYMAGIYEGLDEEDVKDGVTVVPVARA
jgi:hypothetical protein